MKNNSVMQIKNKEQMKEVKIRFSYAEADLLAFDFAPLSEGVLSEGAVCRAWKCKIKSAKDNGEINDVYQGTYILKEYCPRDYIISSYYDDEHQQYFIKCADEGFDATYVTYCDKMDAVRKFLSDLSQNNEQDEHLKNKQFAQNFFVHQKLAPNCYTAFFFSRFESVDVQTRLMNDELTSEKKLLIVKKLAEFSGECHSRGFMLADIKPSNFLFNEATQSIQFFDIDAITEVDKNGIAKEKRINATPFYASSAMFDENALKSNCDDIFACGRVLLKLFFNSICPRKLNQYVLLRDVFSKTNCDALKKQDPNITDVFLNELKKVITQATVIHSFTASKGASEFAKAIEELELLYRNKGMSPNILKQNAQRKFNKVQVDEKLLTDIIVEEY